MNDNQEVNSKRAKRFRPDHDGVFRGQFETNKKKILATQDVCGICGKPVDKRLRWPNPMSPVIDHIIPIDRGGHPSDLDNLQLAHMCCNRAKANKLMASHKAATKDGRDAALVHTNRNLPLSMDWTQYHPPAPTKE